MITRNILKFLTLLLMIIGFAGCAQKKADTQQTRSQEPAAEQVVSVDQETQLLLDDLRENGDYVNSREFPSLIKASIVHDNLDKKIHVIDIRSAQLFAEGHIKGAVNKRFEDLPTYFENDIKPFEFEKIIIVSDDGQVSAYTTMLLRLIGYGNVFSMRWGMSAWNKKIADKGWLKGVTGKYESKLDTITHVKPSATALPLLKTMKTSGQEIGQERYKKLFEEGTANVLISAEEVFGNPDKYFVINYDRKDKYEKGHIPGAVRFKPDETLGFVSEMGSIPADKTVVVYCGTGHNSAFVTAYLRLFGYDARTLQYGNNGFMYNKMVSEKVALSWQPFTNEDVNNYEVVK